MLKKYSSTSITRTGFEEFEKTLIDPAQRELFINIILPNISRDPMSHVLNKRVFLEKYINEFQRTKNGNFIEGLAFILIGINEYDVICEMDDDTGDEVLNKTGKLLKKSFRNKDIIGRFSDNRFSIVLIEISKTVAVSRAKDLIYSFSREEMGGLYFSISAGLAYFDGTNFNSPFQLIEKAEEKLDKAMLRAPLKEPLY